MSTRLEMFCDAMITPKCCTSNNVGPSVITPIWCNISRDAEQLKINAKSEGWHEVRDVTYCPECWKARK